MPLANIDANGNRANSRRFDSEVEAKQFLAIVQIRAAIGKIGMAPEDIAPPGAFRWFENLRAAD